jgi:dihydroflavonol-4-reductase
MTLQIVSIRSYAYIQRYFYSKKLSEEAGWNAWNQHKDKFDFTVVNPLLVLGPTQTANLNASLKGIISKILMGEIPKLNPGTLGLTDVRDVADAHIVALENSGAVGKRLICASGTTTWKELANTMKRRFPMYPVHTEPGTDEIEWTLDTSDLEVSNFHDYLDH